MRGCVPAVVAACAIFGRFSHHELWKPAGPSCTVWLTLLQGANDGDMAAPTETGNTTTPSATDTDDTAATPVKVLGKRELLERVVIASGIKKRAAKPVVEAMLKELGDAFARGETVNLQPFGKGIVKSFKDLENAQVLELRLRRSKTAVRAAETGPKDPLAEAAE